MVDVDFFFGGGVGGWPSSGSASGVAFSLTELCGTRCGWVFSGGSDADADSKTWTGPAPGCRPASGYAAWTFPSVRSTRITGSPPTT